MGSANRTYTDEFKRQIVALKESGKSTREIEAEYGVTRTSINEWARQLKNSGKFGAIENMSESEKELRILRKENKQLRMENDILKQAALILGRKGE